MKKLISIPKPSPRRLFSKAYSTVQVNLYHDFGQWYVQFDIDPLHWRLGVDGNYDYDDLGFDEEVMTTSWFFKLEVLCFSVEFGYGNWNACFDKAKQASKDKE